MTLTLWQFCWLTCWLVVLPSSQCCNGRSFYDFLLSECLKNWGRKSLTYDCISFVLHCNCNLTSFEFWLQIVHWILYVNVWCLRQCVLARLLHFFRFHYVAAWAVSVCRVWNRDWATVPLGVKMKWGEQHGLQCYAQWWCFECCRLSAVSLWWLWQDVCFPIMAMAGCLFPSKGNNRMPVSHWWRYWNKSWHRKLSLAGEKILPPLLLGIKCMSFRSLVQHSTAEPHSQPVNKAFTAWTGLQLGSCSC